MFPVPIFSSNVGVDTGDIGHSLRFRGAQYLSKTITTSTVSTYSFFVKRGKLGVISPIVESSIKFNADDTLTAFGMTTTAVFRDPTSWVHVHISREGLYVNGVRLGAVTTSSVVNGRIGCDGTAYFDGYLARVCVVDGASSSYSNFGYFNTEINEWCSKTQSQVKAVVDAGGANSFMLDFDDGTSLTTLGYNKSSKGNNWTLNNFSLTAGPTYDWMLDVPGNSYATLNPLIPSAANITNGNLSSGTTAARATMNSTAFDSQWFVTAGASAVTAGVIDDAGTTNTTTVTANKVFAFKMTATGSLSYKNVTDAGSWTSIATGLTGNRWPYSVTQAASWNFGQQPLPEALYTGFNALCQANLPEPAIKSPKKHFDVLTVTKSGNAEFTCPWNATDYDTLFEIKRRDAGGSWYLIDGLRGYHKYLRSNSTATDATDYRVLTVSGTTCTLGSTLADGTYVISMYKAGLASARQTNTAGSITSTVSANIAAGFSIVTFQLQATGSKTVGHGLGKALNLLHLKPRIGYDWFTFDAVNGPTKFMNLNSTAHSTADSTVWDNTAPTSSVFTVGSGFTSAAYDIEQVAYCFAEIPGYSKFGSYTGNESADGPCVNLGFKPKKLTIKLTSGGGGNWITNDAARNLFNPTRANLYSNLTNLEDSNTYVLPDFTSHGYKIRSMDGRSNASAATYIYSAYADVAGKYSLGK